ncbi:MAG TPA: endolytic transglycosylase MltG [Chloroflexi bacterium]|nr:endolytic transglycosylase MltG [Chloroflexota bacterium]
MNRAIRIALRLVTLVLTLSTVIVVVGGGLWYVWQDARGRTPQVSYTLTAKKLQRAALGAYLKYRDKDVSIPANPADGHEVSFTIEPGDTVAQVADELERLGLITDAGVFRRLLQYHGADSNIEAGVFVLRPNMAMREIMEELQHGRLATTTVTVLEGWRAEETAAALEQAGIVSAEAFMQVVRGGAQAVDAERYAFLRDRPEGSPTDLEGYLFPDTYQFPQESDAVRVVETMLQNWDQRVSEDLREKAQARGMTLYEVLTLASIVEREAVVDEERPRIAGVYLNRLEADMRLEADPTVQYALGLDAETGRWWTPLTIDQVQNTDSPYNTYRVGGLPPGPICNPGLASIQAVLNPEPTDYLYFVANKVAGDGSHVFALTFDEHVANIQQYGQ